MFAIAMMQLYSNGNLIVRDQKGDCYVRSEHEFRRHFIATLQRSFNPRVSIQV